MRRQVAILGCVALALAACGSNITPAETSALTAVAGTLASVAAANNTTVAALVTKGQLFCSGSSGVFTVVGAMSAPTSVVGQTASAVAKACATVDAVAVPVSPPSAAATVPVVVAPGALAPS